MSRRVNIRFAGRPTLRGIFSGKNSAGFTMGKRRRHRRTAKSLVRAIFGPRRRRH